jgi:hypothetical protein
MATLTYVKLNGFVEHQGLGLHDMAADTFTLALSNTAPAAEASDPSVLTADCILASITEIDYSFCSSRVLTNNTGAQAGGVFTFDADNITLTAGGGNIGPFQYIYIYNETSAGDLLVGYYNLGAALTLSDTQTITFTFDAAGILTVT